MDRPNGILIAIDRLARVLSERAEGRPGRKAARPTLNAA
jgi:hypothetical protein